VLDLFLLEREDRIGPSLNSFLQRYPRSPRNDRNR
jgi:hypothetical protein